LDGRRGTDIPKTVDELSKIELTVIKGSSYVERLRELREEAPNLQWQISKDLNTEGILAEIWEKNLDCTLADSNIVAINRRYYPELSIAFPIAEEQQLTWVLRHNSPALQTAASEWLNQFEQEGRLAQVLHRYYGHAEIFDYVDTARYHRRIRKRLPKYEAMFKAAAEKYSLSWMLLAAQSYQESHWNPIARSPTGVRGIMMLTRVTAREMGVKNRLDPEPSIVAGAKYLAKLIERVPDSVNGPDRMKFALAAYNVGMGHIKDARELAVRLGKNPDTWNSLRTVLPLLSKKEYYKTLRYGYARGSEPVRYLDRIYNYRDILHQIETAKEEGELEQPAEESLETITQASD
ncbi:MAG: membrane-bound lytic murein transglycosylase MltF, partial [Pseudomonadota bacterium]